MKVTDFLMDFRYPEIDPESAFFHGYVLKIDSEEIEDYASQGYVVFKNEQRFLEKICEQTYLNIRGDFYEKLNSKNIDEIFVDFPHQMEFSKYFTDTIESISKIILQDEEGCGLLFWTTRIPIIDKAVLYNFLWHKCIDKVLMKISEFTPYFLYVSENQKYGMKEIFLKDQIK